MRTSFLRRVTACLLLAAAVVLAGATAAYATHTDPSGNPLPHATLKVWNTQPDLGFDPNESVDDVSGLTTHVGSPAVVTVIENTTHSGGPCGVIFWNPDTNDFKWYGVTFGFQAAVDINRSAPVLTGPGGKTFQPGDSWQSGPTSSPSVFMVEMPIYVNFKGSDDFRGYQVALGEHSWGVKVDQKTGHVWYAGFEDGTIGRLNPATNERTRWDLDLPAPAAPAEPRYITLDATGKVYVTVGGLDQVVRLNPATNEVTRWDVPGVGDFEEGFLFETPDGITVDASGDVWFTESQSAEVGRLNPALNTITEYTKTGLLDPQLIATSGSGATLQSFFTEGEGNAVSIVTSEAAVGVSTAVLPVTSTVTPVADTVTTEDFSRTPLTKNITPETFDIPGVNGGPDAKDVKTPTGERIPGILRLPMPLAEVFPSGITDVFKANTVAGSWLGKPTGFPPIEADRVWQLTSGAIIAPPEEMPPAGVPGKVTGGGSIPAGSKATFGFVGISEGTIDNAKGNIQYVDHAAGVKIHASVTSVAVSGTHATLKGTGTQNGAPVDVTVEVDDNAEPGKGTDTFKITTSAGYSNGGVLTGGNIQIHKS